MTVDVNPIYDPGAPKSIGGVNEAAKICDMLEVSFDVKPPKEEYMHAWGDRTIDAKPIIASWELTTFDIHHKPCTFEFDLLEGDEPIIIGLDVGKHCIQNNIANPPYLHIQRPQDSSPRIFNTYLKHEKGSQLNLRVRVEIIPQQRTCIRSLMSRQLSLEIKRSPKIFAKRIHRLTHAPEAQVLDICRQAGVLSDEVKNAVHEVSEACGICASTGRPAPSVKISLTHVNEAFNREIQVDFGFAIISDQKQLLFVITDMGTSFSEGCISDSRLNENICKMLEHLWIFRHGAPAALSADDEYNRAPLRSLLNTHYITLKPRPARRHNKTGVAERKIQTIKRIIERLDKETSSCSRDMIVARAIFLSNFFSGSTILSSFQLARGYQPSIIGIPHSIVSQDVLDAHVEQCATRALQRAMKARDPNVDRCAAYKTGDDVWVWYATTAGNQRDEWIRAKVVQAHPHFLEVKRLKDGASVRGPNMKPAYEDVRLAPKSDLAKELTSSSLEDELAFSAVGGEEVDVSTERDNQPPNANALMTQRLPRNISRSMVDIGIEAAQGTKAYSVLGANANKERHKQNTSTDYSERGRRIHRKFDGRIKKMATCADRRNRIHTDKLADNIGDLKSVPATSAADRQTKLDIGVHADNIAGPPDPIQVLQSEKPRILSEIYDVLGSQQVSRRKMEFAPSWILEEAFKAEHDSNWAGAYVNVSEENIPRDANIVRSHTVYKVKVDESGDKKLKARICPHGNEDAEKDEIRKDSANAQLGIIRLLLSLVTFLSFDIWTADIKGAYLQSGPIKRTIYVRPPMEWAETYGQGRNILWRLVKLPYGIVEAGRQWMLVIEEWMLTDGKMQRVHGLSQLFIRRDKTGGIILLVAKLSDDFLMAGSQSALHEFSDSIHRRFEVGKLVKGPAYQFGGCDIKYHTNGDVSMEMSKYWKRVKPLEISRSRRRMRDAIANAKETLMYRSLAGTLLYLGGGSLPQASLVVSLMQQKLGNLRVKHLVEANEMVSELRRLKPILTYKKVLDPTSVSLFTFSDAAHPQDRDYGQTGLVIGIVARNITEDRIVFHVLDWTSQKQQRVSHSAYGAEILAASSGDDRGYFYKQAINTLFPKSPLKHDLNVDSKGLWDTITTLHEGKEYRLRQTVQRIRNSFEAQELNVLRWIPGTENVADALTKRNMTLWRKLNDMIADGIFNVDIRKARTVDKEDW
eukprot:GFKZ01014258.1.p1 GENE.GFKZ01014258.1~~GFKZ01014258.1.p1  ORF type:complete len:1202 (-),score=97.36 GFKZ01014258.1:1881-5486(-)